MKIENFKNNDKCLFFCKIFIFVIAVLHAQLVRPSYFKPVPKEVFLNCKISGTIFDMDAKEYKGLQSVRINDKLFVLKEKGWWVEVLKKDLPPWDLIKSDKETILFRFKRVGWAISKVKYLESKDKFKGIEYDDLEALRFKFLFTDFDKTVDLGKDDLSLKYPNLFKKNVESLGKKELKEIQKEGLDALAMVYKIHFQVKLEYLIDFVEDFAKFILENKICKQYIYEFKFPRTREAYFSARDEESVASMVVYLCLIPGSRKEKNQVVGLVLDEILKRYGKKGEELDCGVMPRFSKRIKDFVYIAGGGGDTKGRYLERLQEGWKLKGDIYTGGMAFFKGYEIDYEPKEK